MPHRHIRFLDEVKAFELRDKLSPPPIAPVLLYGSSSIRLWESVSEDLPEWTIVRRGLGGSTLEECDFWCERMVIRYAPSRIILYAGDNDLADGASPEMVMHRFQRITHKIYHALGPTPLTYISIKPSPARWGILDKILHTNHLLKILIQRHDQLRYLDIVPHMLTSDGRPRTELYADDGLHLSRMGYKTWSRLLLQEADF